MKIYIVIFLFPLTTFAQINMEHCLSIEDQQFQITRLVMNYEYCKKNPNKKDCSPKETEKLLNKVNKGIHQSQSNQAEFEKCKPLLYK